MEQPKSTVLVRTLYTLAGLGMFIFWYPRLLVNFLGEANPWTSYLYLYGFGFVFWSAGVILILRTGACQLGRGYDKVWFKVIVGGLLFFMVLHALWILAAQHVPFLGDGAI